MQPSAGEGVLGRRGPTHQPGDHEPLCGAAGPSRTWASDEWRERFVGPACRASRAAFCGSPLVMAKGGEERVEWAARLILLHTVGVRTAFPSLRLLHAVSRVRRRRRRNHVLVFCQEHTRIQTHTHTHTHTTHTHTHTHTHTFILYLVFLYFSFHGNQL